MHTRVVHITSAHRQRDPRIFHKECVGLAQAGYEVSLIAPGDANCIENGVRHVCFTPPGSRLARWTAGQARIVRQLLTMGSADLYHFHDPDLLPLAMMLRILGHKVIFDFHEDYPKTVGYKNYVPRWLMPPLRLLFRAMDIAAGMTMTGIVAASMEIKAKYPAEKTVLFRNLPDFSEWIEADRSTPPRLIYVGAVSEARGLGAMLRLAHAVEDCGAELVLIGKWPEGEPRPAGKNVLVRGLLDRQQVARELSQASIGLSLLKPYPSYVEALPVKVFEYLAAGLPVIASDFPASRAAFGESGAVHFVDPLDDDAIAAIAKQLLRNLSTAREQGEIGRRYVMEHFPYEKELQGLVGFYRRILSK